MNSDTLIRFWSKLKPLPGGSRLFSFILGRWVPYSGSIRPQVVSFRPGFCRIKLCDRRGVRNHLHSIHAMALANAGELATGLALLSALPKGMRAIVVDFSIKYVKKARGEILASSVAPNIAISEDKRVIVEGKLVDSAGDVVASVEATWKVGKQKPNLTLVKERSAS